MRSVVLIQGLLTGMGREAPCVMLALKDSPSSTSTPVFSRCSVVEAPPDLPDGLYTVTFNGYTVPARKESGLWPPDSEPVAAPTETHFAAAAQKPLRGTDTIEIMPLLKDHVA